MLYVVFDERYADHVTGTGHPERAARVAAIIEGLEAGGCFKSDFVRPVEADVARIKAVHQSDYVELIERFCNALADDGTVAELPTGDTMVARASYDIARLAAGGALEAVRLAEQDRPVLAVVRPPGHHAGPGRGMGFCVFNNVAVAAQLAREEFGSTLIVDFDYHHGNGTQEWVQTTFGDGGQPLGFVSTHAFPAYPGTGSFRDSQVQEERFIIDLPLPHSTETDDFIAVWASVLPPLARRLKPKTILVSAGFDFLAGDPIAGLPIAVRAVDALCALLGNVADEHRARLALILEGGYSLENLRSSAASLARDFSTHAGSVGVPGASPPHDARLRAMVDAVLTV